MPSVQTTKISSGPILKHPDDDRLYYMDWTDDLATDELIQTVVSADVFDGTGAPLADLEVAPLSLLPNPLPFQNSQRRPVAAGKAALLRVSGGLHGIDYYVEVKVTTSLPNTIARVGIFQVRAR